MATFLHTMVRITDPERSREFYEALGFRFSRDMDIVREGEREATNYFFSIGDQDDVLELTFNHDGRTDVAVVDYQRQGTMAVQQPNPLGPPIVTQRPSSCAAQ